MSYTQKVLEELKARYPEQPEFIQAATEILGTIQPALDAHPEYEEAALLERLVEPERIVMFRVPWVDDQGKVQVNRGYRVEFNSAIGPYKGGLRFNPTVTLGMLPGSVTAGCGLCWAMPFSGDALAAFRAATEGRVTPADYHQLVL